MRSAPFAANFGPGLEAVEARRAAASTGDTLLSGLLRVLTVHGGAQPAPTQHGHRPGASPRASSPLQRSPWGPLGTPGGSCPGWTCQLPHAKHRIEMDMKPGRERFRSRPRRPAESLLFRRMQRGSAAPRESHPADTRHDATPLDTSGWPGPLLTRTW